MTESMCVFLVLSGFTLNMDPVEGEGLIICSVEGEGLIIYAEYGEGGARVATITNGHNQPAWGWGLDGGLSGGLCAPKPIKCAVQDELNTAPACVHLFQN